MTKNRARNSCPFLSYIPCKAQSAKKMYKTRKKNSNRQFIKAKTKVNVKQHERKTKKKCIKQIKTFKQANQKNKDISKCKTT